MTSAANDEVVAIVQEAPLRRALRLWFPVLGGIGAWTVHLMFVSSWARYACTSHRTWPLHVATAVLSLVTVAAALMGARLIRIGRGSDPGSSGLLGNLHFVGQVAVLLNIINLALILLEGLYATVTRLCV